MESKITIQLKKSSSFDTDIKIIATGDFCPWNSKEIVQNNLTSQRLFGQHFDELTDNDLFITNLECPVTEEKCITKKLGPNLKADEKSLELIKGLGNVLVCLANNHILDYGEIGIKDTMRKCEEKNIFTVGAGNNLAEASCPKVINLKNQKIAILNYAEKEFSIATKDSAGANPFDVIDVCEDIESVRSITSIILVIIHAGIEHYDLPSPLLVKKLRFIARYKPTAIICHHTHVSSGYEVFNEIPIFYSLGNFLFKNLKSVSEKWFLSYYLKLYVGIKDGLLHKIDITPFVQFKNGSCLEKLTESENIQFISQLNKFSNIITNTENLDYNFNYYVKKNGMERYSFLTTQNKFFRRLFSKIKPFRYIINKLHNNYSIYGVINCDSHREVLLRQLENQIFKK